MNDYCNTYGKIGPSPKKGKKAKYIAVINATGIASIKYVLKKKMIKLKFCLLMYIEVRLSYIAENPV